MLKQVRTLRTMMKRKLMKEPGKLKLVTERNCKGDKLLIDSGSLDSTGPGVIFSKKKERDNKDIFGRGAVWYRGRECLCGTMKRHSFPLRYQPHKGYSIKFM